ncbi:MAG: DUF481 domain-containing protein [Aeromonas sp.]
MMRQIPIFWLLLALALSPAALARDTLWMKNGDRLSGVIDDITAEVIRIELPYAGMLEFKRSDIKRWRLRPQEKPTLPKGKIVHKKAPDNEDEWLWAGHGDLNVKLKQNDQQKNYINFQGKTEVANLNWRYTLASEYNYDTADGETDSHDYRVLPTFDYFFNDDWFVRTALNYEYEMVDDNYLSVDLGAGPGYRFWSDKRRRLELMAQAGMLRTFFRRGDNEANRLFAGTRIFNYPFASLSWDYRQPIALGKEQVELFSQGTYLRYLSQASPLIERSQDITGAVGLRYYFNEHLRLSWFSEMEWKDGVINLPGYDQRFKETEWRHLLTLGASF